MCIIIQTITVYAVVILFVSGLILIIGFSMFMTDYANDLKENLFAMNEDLIKITYPNPAIFVRMKIKKRFTEIIQFHSDARELVYYLNWF